MSVDTKEFALPVVHTGAFTSAGTAAAVTETLGFQPSVVFLVIDSGGTNPNIYMKFKTETDESLLITGTTGVITSPADASGITLTASGFTAPAGIQVNSGTNQWLAIR